MIFFREWRSDKGIIVSFLNKVLKGVFVLSILACVLTGCANVQKADPSSSDYAKEFNIPPKGYAGVYLYRNFFMGCGLYKNLYIDGQYLGESDRSCFFYRLARPGLHEIQTESEFSENSIQVNMEEGQNYYIYQWIKPGIFVGRADIELVEPEKAKEEIKTLERAQDQDGKQKDLVTPIPENKGSIPGPKSKEEAQSSAL